MDNIKMHGTTVKINVSLLRISAVRLGSVGNPCWSLVFVFFAASD